MDEGSSVWLCLHITVQCIYRNPKITISIGTPGKHYLLVVVVVVGCAGNSVAVVVGFLVNLFLHSHKASQSNGCALDESVAVVFLTLLFLQPSIA